ncbi:MAG: ATP-binding protein [Oscillospiraceae bacterium]|nr:ATP-binding protein [Oscillospiraceae bacterium]
MDWRNFDRKLDMLTVFSTLKHDAVFRAFRQCFCQVNEKREDDTAAVAEFAAALYHLGHTDNWTDYLKELVLSMENPCSYFAAKGQEIPAYIDAAARSDLRLLSEAAAVTAEMILDNSDTDGLHIPEWFAEYVDLETLYFERLSKIDKHGYGMYAKYKMFHMEPAKDDKSGFVLEPVAFPDAVALSDLIGYELQRNQVIANTQALISGQKASNVLLYGDAGTGKSATVKAVANAFSEDGLRLIELTKNELHLLPKLLEELSENPLKFILFIDDLSFQENDDDFSALKAVLEGSISSRSLNTVVYATSNRRHIIRETFSQRAGDEIHRNDSMQETISLSERFGIKIYYEKPNKALYLDIVNGLAAQYGLHMSAEALSLEAERFALRKCGRSARAARQLIEQLVAAQNRCEKE